VAAIGTLFKVKRLIIKKVLLSNKVLFAQGFTHPASGCNHDTLPKNYLKNMIEKGSCQREIENIIQTRLTHP
jgi:hypothetical protein